MDKAMDGLTHGEREALRLVGVGAMQIRALARLLPDSAETREILALADGMHNIPGILAGSAQERQASQDRLNGDVAALHSALRLKASGPRLTTSGPTLTLVKPTLGTDA